MIEDPAKATWVSALPEELTFWEYWLTTDEAGIAAQRRDRLNALERLLIPALAASAAADEEVRVLDVGAGPLTVLGARIDGRMAEIVAVDPLAEPYAELLERLEIEPPIPTVRGEGEDLARRFGDSSFHGVYCGNALDHCHAPMRVVRQMVSVVKPGGTVVLFCYHNVGEIEEYQGLHQWNVTVRGGRVVIWSRSEEIDVAGELGASATVEGRINDEGFVDVWITKAAAAQRGVEPGHVS